MKTKPESIRVVVIGIGGATSTGKTVLANHLKNCLPNSYIIHQDDFFPPSSTLPVDPEFGFLDGDAATTAVDWDRMAEYISKVKQSGTLPDARVSFPALNDGPTIPVDEGVILNWRAQIARVSASHLEKHNERLVWVIVDGFLMYWDERIVTNLDIRVFLRAPEDIARARRESRTYLTPEGSIWRDPPRYWEKIVWPAYLDAHKHLFEGGDVVSGSLSQKIDGLILLESTQTEMEDMISRVMNKIVAITY